MFPVNICYIPQFLIKKKKKDYKEVLLKILHIITEPNNAIFTLSSLQQRIREKKKLTNKQKTVSLHYRLDCSSSCNMGVIQLWVSKLPSVPFPFTKLCSWSR